MRVSWRQALAWRMRRQLLDPIGTLPAVEVVRRLGGVQAQVASSADLAIRVRSTDALSGEVSRALSEGSLIRTWAMRGALHLLTPEEGGAFLSLMADAKTWERPAGYATSACGASTGARCGPPSGRRSPGRR